MFYLVAEGGKIKDKAWSDHAFNRRMQQERHDKRMLEQREDKKKAWDARSEIERKRKLPPRKCSFTSQTHMIPNSRLLYRLYTIDYSIDSLQYRLYCMVNIQKTKYGCC